MTMPESKIEDGEEIDAQAEIARAGTLEIRLAVQSRAYLIWKVLWSLALVADIAVLTVAAAILLGFLGHGHASERDATQFAALVIALALAVAWYAGFCIYQFSLKGFEVDLHRKRIARTLAEAREEMAAPAA